MVGVTIGIVFLGESLTIERFAGMALILVGVIAMTWRRAVSQRPAPSGG